jgi:hypothetical protein
MQFSKVMVSIFLALLAIVVCVNGLPKPGRLNDYDAGEIEVPKSLQPKGPTPYDDFTDSNETKRKYFFAKINPIIKNHFILLHSIYSSRRTRFLCSCKIIFLTCIYQHRFNKKY